MSASTILLVDDDEVPRQVLHRVLTRDGYTVVQAGSVAEALQCAREQTPSLGLIDLRLPDGDGVELACRLEEQVDPFPLILITAYPLRLRDRPELVKAFAHVLTKPLDLDALRQAIQSNLGSPARMVVVHSPKTGESDGETLPAPSPSPPPVKTAGKRLLLHWSTVGIVVLVVAILSAALPPLLSAPSSDSQPRSSSSIIREAGLRKAARSMVPARVTVAKRDDWQWHGEPSAALRHPRP